MKPGSSITYSITVMTLNFFISILIIQRMSCLVTLSVAKVMYWWQKNELSVQSIGGMISLLSSIAVHCGPWLPMQWCSVSPGLWPLQANFYFPSISPSFLSSSLFLYFFHSGSCYLFWPSFVIHAFSLSIPFQSD